MPPRSVAGVLTALRSRDFRLLWLSQTASTLGDGLVLVAVGLFVTRLTGDPSDVGLVLAGYSVPGWRTRRGAPAP